jgi:hypothetical protein
LKLKLPRNRYGLIAKTHNFENLNSFIHYILIYRIDAQGEGRGIRSEQFGHKNAIKNKNGTP